jgi:hypothetical protein
LIAKFDHSIFDNHSFGRFLLSAHASVFVLESAEARARKERIEMMERLLDIEVTERGTVLEKIEVICCMTGFSRRFLIHHIGEGFYQSVELF